MLIMDLNHRQFLKYSAAAASAFSVPFSGCIGGRNKLKELGIGYQPHCVVERTGILAASQIGDFDKTKCSYQAFLSGTPLISSMIAKEIMTGYLGDMPAIIGTDKGTMEGGGVIVSKDINTPSSTCALIAQKGRFNSLNELDEEGIEIKCNYYAYPHRWFLRVINKFGFDNIQPQDLIDGDPTTFADMCMRRNIDAFILWEQPASTAIHRSRQLENRPDLKAVKRGGAEVIPGFSMSSVTMMHPDLVNKHREKAVEYLKEHLLVHKLFTVETDRSLDILCNHLKEFGYSRKSIEMAFEHFKPGIGNYNPIFSEEKIKELYDATKYLEKNGIVSEEAYSNLEDHIDLSLLKKAADDLEIDDMEKWLYQGSVEKY